MRSCSRLALALWALGAIFFLNIKSAHALTQKRSTLDAHHIAGKRAFRAAKRFAIAHNLPHFTVTKNGIARLVLNVSGEKIGDWVERFSQKAGFAEIFFHGTDGKPGWSYLRLGKKAFKEYGEGRDYDLIPSLGRIGFPIWLTAAEIARLAHAIESSPNLPWDYNGGIWNGTGQNCTDWLTHKIGAYSGVETNSIKHHFRALAEGQSSPRTTVMVFITQTPIVDFGLETLSFKRSE